MSTNIGRDRRLTESAWIGLFAALGHRTRRWGRPSLALLAMTSLLAPIGLCAAQSPTPSTDALESGFLDPPPSARPRVWWHWLNGNITQDGIAKDLAWMKRVGIGGVQAFDASIKTPQIVDTRLIYMTPQWQDAFRFAATQADQLQLELGIASSPGFSETGGPWVAPEDGMKKLVWSETPVVGGKRYHGQLAAPPSLTGPYQGLPATPDIADLLAGGKSGPPKSYYADVAVLAVPGTQTPELVPHVISSDGEPVDGSALFDGKPETTVTVHGEIGFVFDTPQTIRSATLFAPGAVPVVGPVNIAPRLEVTEDGTTWRPIATFTITPVPTTVSFAPVTASKFRLVVGGVGPAAAQHRNAKIGEFELSSAPRIDRHEIKAAFAVVQNYYALATSAAESERGIAAEQVMDITHLMRPDGTLDWTPPKGTWRVLRFGYSLTGVKNHPATAEATGLEVDKYDGEAVRRYLETYLGMYRAAVGQELFGQRGVRALVTDSIEAGMANWTPHLIEEFRRLRGYDPMPWLPALTGIIIGSRAQSDAFLYDFRRTLADLISSEHYGTVATVAHEEGLRVYGEALEDHRPLLGDDMAMRSHTDVPMAAMWTYARDAGPRPTYIADIKGAASVAHVYGQNFVAAESMTSLNMPWAFAPADLRRVIDLEFATGVNLPVIHTSVHVPLDDKIPGLSLYIFGQYFNRHETWAEMAKPWVDYIARNSFLLQQGRDVADVAYFYGEEGPLTGLFGDGAIPHAPIGYGFDFINADILVNRLSIERGMLQANGRARYRVLYLGGSSQRMTLPTLRKLVSLVEAGAVVVGEAPIGSPSLGEQTPEYQTLVKTLWDGSPVKTVGQGRVILGDDLDSALASLGIGPDFRYEKPLPDSQILFTHRSLDDGEIYFVNNRQNRAETIEAHFRVVGKVPEIWRADTRTIEPVSYRIEGSETIVPLSFDAEDSFFVIFRKPASATTVTVRRPTLHAVATLEGPWSLTFQANRGAPPSATLATLESLSAQSDPGIKYFSGVTTYRKSFLSPRGWQPGSPLILDLGQVADLAEVLVNGRAVGTVWHPPFRLDIGNAVKRGANRLDVRVANVWVNRLIGDAQPGAQRITYTSNPTYTADTPLRPSGLLGPVQLELTDANRLSSDLGDSHRADIVERVASDCVAQSRMERRNGH